MNRIFTKEQAELLKKVVDDDLSEAGAMRAIVKLVLEQTGMFVRDPVYQFAMDMESTLRKHDSRKGFDGWVDESLDYLMDKLEEEVGEVRARLNEPIKDPTGIRNEAIDVANLAMMIWIRAVTY